MFDEQYQLELIHKLTKQRFVSDAGLLLESSMFDPDYEDLMKDALARIKKTGKALSQGQLKQLCNRHKVKLNGVAVKGNHAFDVEEVKTFSRAQILQKALTEARVHCETGKFEKGIETVTACRKKFPRSGEEIPDSLLSTSPFPKRKNLVPTGLKELDEKLNGGIAGGDVAVVMASTSGGKTSWLVFVTCTALKSGLKVAYFTLEVSRCEIEGKIRCGLTGLEQKKCKKNDWVKAAKKSKRSGGRLKIWESTPHFLSIDDIDREVDKDTNLIVLDPGDNIRLSSNDPKLRYLGLGDLYDGLKTIGLERSCPIWVSSQINRGGYEKEEIGVVDAEGSLQKPIKADQVITINPEGDQEPDPETGNVRAQVIVAKNRHGERFGKVPAVINWPTCLFEYGEHA